MTEAGILVVDKTAGVTSFDAVTLVRRRLGLRRVGHAGTLDPDATGVLPMLLGEATKLMAYLADQDKEYVATLRLGVTTDTGDLGGRVVAESPVPVVDRAQMEAACRPFVGRIKQVPPMYSAVHHEGRRLYDLAREGIEVVREPREVVIHAIEVQEVALPRVGLRVVCGKGTYLRTLAADLGATLGCGAAVERLVRTRVGPFRLTDAVAWEVLVAEPASALWARVRPAETALVDWPALRLDARAVSRFEHGQAVEIAPPRAAGGSLVRVHAADGRLLGVGEVIDGRRTRPVRVLHADRPGTRVRPA
ncbi:MAG TPA: tRNA pseudouridine(55) synthase TruB [Methylomirabilota bacterium]